MRTCLSIILAVLLSTGGFYLYHSKRSLHQETAPTEKLSVVASFSILGDIVQNIGRQHVDVKTIVGPNVDAHIYRPTPETAKVLSQADLVIINGLGFEGWIERLVEASGYQGEVVIAAQGLVAKMLTDKDGNTLKDPHTWNSVENVIRYVQNITKALQRHDPAHEMAYAKYSQYYIDQLRVLDAWIRQEIAEIPENRRTVITAHDAFQYFGLEYGITFLAPVGITTEEEPSAKATAQLIDQIKIHDIQAVFIENATNTKLIEAIATEAGVRIAGTLYVDALSEDRGPAPTYIAMMRHNTTELVKSMRAGERK